MNDEAILALVKNQLGSVAGALPTALPVAGTRRRGRPPRAAAAAQAPSAAPVAAKPAGGKRGAGAKRKPGRPRRSPAASQERQDTLNLVEKLVKSSQGVSASDVAKQAGVPQTRAAAALKELKLAKRIFQGGDRRFARYAGDAKTAEQASLSARKNASGPAAAGGSSGKKTAGRGGRKRASSQQMPAQK
ncbi:MAG: hypothetical protein L6Q76_00950 [Polyangiaceae bacterium]|nr:hypothetical protein [Polyangiaceae bacterium]